MQILLYSKYFIFPISNLAKLFDYCDGYTGIYIGTTGFKLRTAMPKATF